MNIFNDDLTRRIFEGRTVKDYPSDLIRKAAIKLIMIESATNLNELATPPLNYLEKSKSGRAGQWSIKVGEKYHVHFDWENGKPHGIEFTGSL